MHLLSRFKTPALVALLSVVALTAAAPAQAAGEFSVTPTTWDVIGIKSNNSGITNGPERFPVGVKVCNTTAATLSNIQTKLVWDSSNSYVNLDGADTNSLGDLDAGKCAQSYYIVKVDRDSAAWNTAREYHIDVTADGGASSSTPTPRQLYVEKLNAQNRNVVNAISGPGGCNADYTVCDPAPTDLEVGKEYTYKVYAETASSYEQLSAFMSFPGSIFNVVSISSEYQIPSGATVDGPYADACGWDPVPTSSTYKSCTGPIPAPFQPGGKVGGKMVVTYKVRATGVGDGELRGLIYDYSGASFHYNQDYPNVPINITIKYPLDVSIVGQGNVKTDVGGIDCGLGATDCHQIYKKDTQVTLTAQPGPGQDFLGWSGDGCSGTDLTCTVTMNQARKIVATFSDKKTGKLTVTKSLSPNDDPGLFDLKIDNVVKATGVGDGGSTGEQTVWEGEHGVSEDANAASPNPLSDYNASLACKDDEGPVAVIDGQVEVEANQKVVCTFTNTRKTGNLTINKSMKPTDDPGRFDLLLDGKAKATYVGDGGTTGKLTLATGQYTVGEQTADGSPNPLSDYNASLECKDDQGTVESTDGKVQVGDGQNITCTWTNVRKTGQLTVKKSLSPSDDPGLFDLRINGDVKASAVGDGGSTGAWTVPTGDQTISEDTASTSPVSLNSYNHSVSCRDDEGDVPVTDAGQLEVGENQNVVCTWTNVRKAGTITINKSLSPTSDPGKFDLKLDGIAKATDVGDGGTTGAVYALQGEHTVSEAAGSSSPTTLDDYNSSLECKIGDNVVDSTGGKVQVGDKQDVVCTYTNTRKAGTLTVKKSLSPNTDPGLFDLKIDGTTKADGVGDGGSTGAQYASAGEHTISEAANSASPTSLSDYNTQLQCLIEGTKTALRPVGDTVQVGDGQDVVCTYTNTRKAGEILINKSLSPASDPGLFDLKLDGTAKATDVGDGGTTGAVYTTAGEHTVSEDAGASSPTALGDYNSSLECKDDEGVVPSTDGKVEVEDGQKITCTFTNTRKAGEITINKSLSPATDPGLFDLKLDGTAKASGVGDGGTTGAQYAAAGEHTVSEAANTSSPTTLGDYNSSLECKDSEGTVSSTNGKVQVGDGQKITCTFTNTRKTGNLTINKTLSPSTDPGLFDLKLDGTVKASGVGDGGTTGKMTLNVGQYTLSEVENNSSPTSLGDYNASLDCKDDQGTVSSTDGKVEVQDGQNITCTWTNVRKAGTLQVDKTLSPTADPGLFDLKIDGTTKATGVGDGGTTGAQYATAGEHTVSEAANASSPTQLTDYNSSLECKDDQGTVPSTNGQVDVQDGQKVVCTFTNTRKAGTLQVDKTLAPSTDPGLFDLKIDGATKASGVGDGGTTGQVYAVVGQYTVSEDINVSSPTKLSEYTAKLECKDDQGTVSSTDGKVDVQDGQKVVCTFTNTRKPGAIVLNKSLSPAADPGLFDLNIDGSAKASGVGDGGTTGTQEVAPGKYSISETANASSPTQLTDYNSQLACQDAKGTVEVVDGKIDVASDQKVTCTFTNTRKAGEITINKSLSPASDPGLFDLKLDGTVKASGVGDGGTTGAQYAVQGEHTVSEAANASSTTTLDDYNSKLECKDGETTVSSTDGKVQVQDGQKIVCTFTNTRKAGTLQVKKSLSPASDPGLFDLKIDGTAKASGVGDGGTTGTQYATQGTHTVSEDTNSSSPTTLADYNAVLACQDEQGTVPSTDGKVDIKDGQAVTCTFTNTRKQAPQFPLQAAVVGSGTVTSNVGGIDCPGTLCNQDYDDGTVVTLVPKAAAGWVFQGWTGDCTGAAASCTVTMSQARSVTAIFAEIAPTRSFVLRVQIHGRKQGRVKTSPAGINCITVCSKSYSDGRLIRLTQRPKAGYYFLRWGGSCRGRGKCVVRMNQFRSVHAYYKKKATAPRFTG